MKENNSYHLIFSEILNSYSLTNHSLFGPVYIKHFSYLELGNLDSNYNIFLQKAISQGTQTYKDREDYIMNNNLWTKNNQMDLDQNEKYLEDLKINHAKDYLPSRRKRLKINIVDAEKELQKLRLKKNFFIGNTAEQWANKQLTYHKIINSYFKDVECKIKLIDAEIEDKDYHELIDLYNQNTDKFNTEMIKKTALSPLVTNLYYLSPDNAYYFYGRAIVNLTSYQTDLFSYAKHFKNILSQYPNIPKEVRQDPEELIEWVDVQNNAKEQKIIGDGADNNNGGTGSIVGATPEDFKILGIAMPTNNLNQALKKAGGTLSKEALFDLTG